MAGHETTASTITWALYELSRNLAVQTKVREEIKATRRHAAQRGDDELTVADLDSMKYLLAVIKVGTSPPTHTLGVLPDLISPFSLKIRRHSEFTPSLPGLYVLWAVTTSSRYQYLKKRGQGKRLLVFP